MLKERKFITLADMQTNVIEVEANRSTSAKLKAKEEKVEKRMKAREEGASSKTKYEDHKIDEITSLHRNISHKIYRMETQLRSN